MSFYDKPMRRWTEAEVGAMVADLETSHPAFWERLKQAELAGGKLGDERGSVGANFLTLIEQAHPDADTWEVASLLAKVRGRLQAELGIRHD